MTPAQEVSNICERLRRFNPDVNTLAVYWDGEYAFPTDYVANTDTHLELETMFRELFGRVKVVAYFDVAGNYMQCCKIRRRELPERIYGGVE